MIRNIIWFLISTQVDSIYNASKGKVFVFNHFIYLSGCLWVNECGLVCICGGQRTSCGLGSFLPPLLLRVRDTKLTFSCLWESAFTRWAILPAQIHSFSLSLRNVLKTVLDSVLKVQKGIFKIHDLKNVYEFSVLSTHHDWATACFQTP